MIARNPSLTDQVKAHLKERIHAGAFDEGRIPSETVLAAELGVSRTTIRDALSRLEHEGTIYRRQGAGTFVNPPGLRIRSRLEEMWSYEDVLRAHGFTPSVRILGIDTLPADASVADDLSIPVGASVIVMEKLFLEDAEPVALARNVIPAGLLRGEPADHAEEPVFAYLEAHCDRRLAYYLSEIVPVVLGGVQAARLGVVDGTAAISFEEVGFDQDEPVVRATSIFRDDLLRFRLIRRKTGT
jgi:GntR family transcriptional regulator